MTFALVQPRTLFEALDTLAEQGEQAKVLAGGTALILLLEQKLIAPSLLVDVGHIPDLDAIREEDDGLHVGPLTRLRELELSDHVREGWPGLAHACSVVGNVRVRNQATMGGNLAEADYASDPPPMLLALDARLTLQSQAGQRTLPLSEFFQGFYTTALEPDELITDIIVPRPAFATRMAYLKFKTRSSEDRPALGVAAVGTFSNGVCTELRVAIGAGVEKPQRLPEVEALARGQTLGDELIAEVAEGYSSQMETLDDLRGSAWYRSQMIRVHIRLALEEIRDGNR